MIVSILGLTDKILCNLYWQFIANLQKSNLYKHEADVQVSSIKIQITYKYRKFKIHHDKQGRLYFRNYSKRRFYSFNLHLLYTFNNVVTIKFQFNIH